MILDYLDHEIDETSLSLLCQTNADGTSADDLVKAANELGFAAQKEYCNSDDLQYYLANGLFPILYINLLAIDGLDITHAVVLETMTHNSATVLDPWRGNRRSIPLKQFEIAWKEMRNLAVLVSQF